MTLMVKVTSLVAVEWRSVVRRIRLVGTICITFELTWVFHSIRIIHQPLAMPLTGVEGTS